jgi:hypothetical protein
MAKDNTSNISLRESIGYLWLGTIGLTICLGFGLLVWFAQPQEPVILLGRLNDFQPNQPTYQALSTELAVYVVNLDGQLLAWDAWPALPKRCSQMAWVPFNHRFEDPCSGAKWCLDGTIADPRFDQVRSLDHYKVEITNAGEVWLYPAQKIEGTPWPDEARFDVRPNQLPPDEIYYCQHLNNLESKTSSPIVLMIKGCPDCILGNS